MLYGDNADPSCLLNEAGTACVWPAPGEDCATAGQYAHFKSPSLQCGSAKMVSLLGDNGYQQANTWCCDAFVWTHTQGLLPSPVAGFACPISIPTIGGGLLPFGSLDTVAAEVCNAMAAPILITRWSIGGGYIPTDRQILGMNECGAHATDGFLIDNGVVTLVYRLGGGGTWDLAFLAVARNPAIGKPEFLLGNSVTAPSVAGQCTAAIRSYSDALTYPGGDPNSITGGTWAPAPGDVVVYNVPGLDVMVERSEDVGTSKWFRVTVENLASNFTIVVPGAQERGAAATEGQPPAPRTPYRPGAQPNGVGEYQDPAVCAAWLADKIATVTDPWTPNPVVSHEMVTIPL
ncbi:hypothetical protein DFJ74DRAFT_658524 [Hyaloraphidium curvatum]|nr:hypothetical protein DFJ74DRAFT_658524 [Hyaloraphidium curvatum]